MQVNLFIDSGGQQVGDHNGGFSSDVDIHAFLKKVDLFNQVGVVKQHSYLGVRASSYVA